MDERCSGSRYGSGGGGGGGGCLGYTWRVGGDVACSTHDGDSLVYVLVEWCGGKWNYM